MAVITSPITEEDGAVLTVHVGVSVNRRAMLEKLNFPVPPAVPVKAQLDTGSFASGFMPSVYQSLQLTPIDEIEIRTPSTGPDTPHITDTFDISITFRLGDKEISFDSVEAIVALAFDQHEQDIQAIIGRDILNKCVLNYDGPHRQFTLVF